MASIVLGNEYVPVDSVITAIMVRELIEGVMFGTTHIGAVVMNAYLTREEKKKSLNILIPSILSGVSLGLIVSIAVGISIVFAVGDHLDTAYGVEVGEGVSKLIGAVFVTDLALKLPKWFGISNFKKAESLKTVEKDLFGQRWEMGFSLFWNVLRESIEGGVLTAVAVILTDESSAALGGSVGVAIAVTFGLALTFGLGAKYISAKFFGIFACVLAQLLAMGLWTGFARAFEEVYNINKTGEEDEGGSRIIYNYENTPYGDQIATLGFLGFSYSLTELTLAVWLISLVVLLAMQYWHNYLGYALFSPTLKAKAKAWKRSVASDCRRKWASMKAGRNAVQDA